MLPGVVEFWTQISDLDKVVLVTARHENLRDRTLAVFNDRGLRYDVAIFGLPVGERICINDNKLSGLVMSYAVNLSRDEGLGKVSVTIDKNR
ncbi:MULTISPECIES: hypothetical protein [Aerosakkonema]|uniref:hypothetical protein n=1 Tax=Aerosakkonema TaxID=1246629 RepID=UPI0035B737A1